MQLLPGFSFLLFLLGYFLVGSVASWKDLAVARVVRESRRVVWMGNGGKKVNFSPSS